MGTGVPALEWRRDVAAAARAKPKWPALPSAPRRVRWARSRAPCLPALPTCNDVRRFSLGTEPIGECPMNPVVAVIAPGMMGAAVGKRLVDHGLKVLTSLKGRSAETVAARQGRRDGVRQRRGDRGDRFHPVDPAAGRRSRAGAAVRAGAHRQQQQADLRRLQRGEPADRRAHRRRHRADRFALRRRRHHRRAAEAERRGARASTPPGRMRRASPSSRISGSTCACSAAP